MPPPTPPWTRPRASPIGAPPSTPPRPACWPRSRRLGAWLVHYSTDYVFDGSGDQPRDETTHRPAERLRPHQAGRRAGHPRQRLPHLILRTSWVYAARGGNFAKHHAAPGAERDALTVIDDQIGAPTGADLLADVTAHAMRSLQPTRTGGTYHCVAAGGETTGMAMPASSSNGHAPTGAALSKWQKARRRCPPAPTPRRRSAR
jgi:dTDP-4-dehydrorhamnose reductase